ncbi:MAG TPA: prepilin-type N-terminal cleavage/methylation domain-containing protein [Vicinamibacterales bacterium]|nr:prepilin-type N-terminal cleavage/methylation domain-containing protein [Vicinamibacterales bacterium]
MRPTTRRRSGDTGFTLIEVLVALVVLSLTASGIAVLFVMSIRDSRAARDQTTAMVMAVERMEQLWALTWGIDAATGVPLSDVTTELGRSPPDGSGNGLVPSPPGSLETNTPGYVDYLDGRGRWMGTGATPPAGATYIRRWHIEPLPADPDTLVLRVLVTTVVRDASPLAAGQRRTRRADEALLVTVKTRKAG